MYSLLMIYPVLFVVPIHRRFVNRVMNDGNTIPASAHINAYYVAGAIIISHTDDNRTA